MAGLFANVDAGERSATDVRFCVAELDECTRRPYSQNSMAIDLASDPHPSDLDGLTLEVTLIPLLGDERRRTRTDTLTYYDGGDGECACSFTSTAVEFPPGAPKM